MNFPNTILIIQARMSSTRFPGKMLMRMNDIPLYKYVYKRCKQVRNIKNVVIATSTDVSDDPLAKSAIKNGCSIYRGSLQNVLKRYISCAREFKAENIIRVCGDSPFVDVEQIEMMLQKFIENSLDYISVIKNHCIHGLDSEIIRLSALEKTINLSDDPDYLEHVTLHIRKNTEFYRTEMMPVDLDPFQGDITLTVDTPNDFKLCDKVATALSDEIGADRFDFTSHDIYQAINTVTQT